MREPLPTTVRAHRVDIERVVGLGDVLVVDVIDRGKIRRACRPDLDLRVDHDPSLLPACEIDSRHQPTIGPWTASFSKACRSRVGMACDPRSASVPKSSRWTSSLTATLFGG